MMKTEKRKGDKKEYETKKDYIYLELILHGAIFVPAGCGFSFAYCWKKHRIWHPSHAGQPFFGGCQLWNSHDSIWPGNFGYEVFFGCGTGVLEYSAAISDSVWTDGQYLFSRNKGTGKSGLAFECFSVCPVSDGEYPLVYFLPSKKRRVKKISSLFLPNLL
jgi:hypothetical protein